LFFILPSLLLTLCSFLCFSICLVVFSLIS
jgi:hypothetical protein